MREVSWLPGQNSFLHSDAQKEWFHSVIYLLAEFSTGDLALGILAPMLQDSLQMLWLAAYLTGFPPFGLHALSWTHGLAPMWSGLYLISTNRVSTRSTKESCAVSMPSRAYTSFLRKRDLFQKWGFGVRVNALSGLYLISTNDKNSTILIGIKCQCPLGLIPHFYLLLLL